MESEQTSLFRELVKLGFQSSQITQSVIVNTPNGDKKFLLIPKGDSIQVRLEESDDNLEYAGTIYEHTLEFADDFSGLSFDYLLRMLVKHLEQNPIPQAGATVKLNLPELSQAPDLSQDESPLDQLNKIREAFFETSPELAQVLSGAHLSVPQIVEALRESTLTLALTSKPDNLPPLQETAPFLPDEFTMGSFTSGRQVDKVDGKSEFTYGVTTPGFRKVFGDSNICMIDLKSGEGESFVDRLGEYAAGARRSCIADDDFVRQGIAYCPPVRVVLQDGHKRVQFAVYVRNKRNNEGQLSQKVSLGLGGHIDGKDKRTFITYDEATGDIEVTDTLDLLTTIFVSMEREVGEEAYFGADAQLLLRGEPVGFVADTEETVGYVGNHHFGAIYPVEVLGDTTFEMTEVNNDALGWFDAADLKLALLKCQDGTPFEPWSKLIIDQIRNLSDDPQEISDMLISMWGLGTDHLEGAQEPVEEAPAVAEAEVQPEAESAWPEPTGLGRGLTDKGAEEVQQHNLDNLFSQEDQGGEQQKPAEDDPWISKI